MTSPPPDDDLQLWQLLRKGDEQAFRRLYRERGGALLRFAGRLTGSRALAEDVLQDVFLGLIAGLDAGTGGFDPGRGSLRSYLFGMAHHAAVRRLRRAGAGGERPSPIESVGQRRDDDEQSVRAALAQLSEPFRDVVLLCELEGLSYEEAAAALAVPVGTIRSRLSRARDQLSRLLSEEPPAARGAARKEVR